MFFLRFESSGTSTALIWGWEKTLPAMKKKKKRNQEAAICCEWCQNLPYEIFVGLVFCCASFTVPKIEMMASEAGFNSPPNRCHLGTIIFQSTASFVPINVPLFRICSRMMHHIFGQCCCNFFSFLFHFFFSRSWTSIFLCVGPFSRWHLFILSSLLYRSRFRICC